MIGILVNKKLCNKTITFNRVRVNLKNALGRSGLWRL